MCAEHSTEPNSWVRTSAVDHLSPYLHMHYIIVLLEFVRMDAKKSSDLPGPQLKLDKNLLASSVTRGHPSSEPVEYRNTNASSFLYGFNYCVHWVR